MDSTAPYWDYLFGNESEALAYAESHDLKTTSIVDVARAIALLPKANGARHRVVVITQGAEPTIVASAIGDGKVEIKEFPTAKIADDEIVDSNGAGDAFAGGFMGKLVLGGDLEQCVKAGQWLAGLCLRSNGPAYISMTSKLTSDIPSPNNNCQSRKLNGIKVVGVLVPI
jgi:adenosine kinase